MASSIILRVCCGVCPVVTQPGRSGTYAHQLLAAFSKTTAYFISAPFALLPEPRPPLSLEIVPDNPKDTVLFNLGPPPPCLWPEDVELAHQLWLEISATGPGAKLHHLDVIGVALRRMIAELRDVGWVASRASGISAQLLVIVQAALGGFQLREAAAFLLDQVILHASSFLARGENLEPGRIAFAEQDPGAAVLSLAGPPVLEVHRVDAAGVGFDPRNRVVADLHASADVELQHHFLGRIGGQYGHRERAFDRLEFRPVIVVADTQPRLLRLLRGRSQGRGDGFPSVHADDSGRAGHHDVLRTKDVVEFDCLGQSGAEVPVIVVRGVAADAEADRKSTR